MKKLLCGALIISLLTIPAFVLADDFDAGEVCHQAQEDAERYVNGGLWFALGCLLPIIGVVTAILMEPTPPATQLLGKSSEYVDVYTDCFKDKGRDIQVRKALIGLLCFPSCGLSLLWL